MKCSIQGCTGDYEQRMIIHTLQYKHEVFVFDNVPAEVCSVCGDTILAPNTVNKLELMLREKTTPEKLIPLYHYA
jgi:YgiT-type zinc finger domain-containing protein